MTDAKEFTVACKDNTLQFTATDGKITKIGIDPTEIVYNTATTINLIATDDNNVEISRYAYGSAAIATNGYEFSINVTSDKGYFVESSKLVLNKIGDTASVKAVKHTGKYENGIEVGNLTFEGTITAIDKTTVKTTTEWTLASVNPYDWSKITPNHDLILGENANLFINIQDENGKTVFSGNPTTYNGYRVVSTNQDVIYANGNQLVPRKEGSAFVNIVDANDNVIYAYSIVVKAAAKPVSFTVNKGSVTISNAAAVTDKATIELVVKDQYGRDYTNSSAYSFAYTNTVAPTGAAATSVFNGTSDAALSGAKTTLTFNGASNTKGSYTWKVELKNSVGTTVYTALVSATVQEPNMSATPTYALLLDGENAAKTIDTTVTASSLNAQTVKVKVGVYYNGVLGAYQSITDANVSMTKPDGTAVTTGSSVSYRSAVTSDEFDFYVRDVASQGAGYFTKTPAGTYTISVAVPASTPGALKTIKQYLTVTDAQTSLSVSKRDSVSIITAASDVDAVLQAFEFVYNNKVLSTTAAHAYEGQITSSDITLVVNESKSDRTGTTKNIYIEKITVKVPVVLGDLNSDGTITDAADVIYIDQTVSTGYFLAYN